MKPAQPTPPTTHQRHCCFWGAIASSHLMKTHLLHTQGLFSMSSTERETGWEDGSVGKQVNWWGDRMLKCPEVQGIGKVERPQ